jgi:hypothetical protein
MSWRFISLLTLSELTADPTRCAARYGCSELARRFRAALGPWFPASQDSSAPKTLAVLGVRRHNADSLAVMMQVSEQGRVRTVRLHARFSAPGSAPGRIRTCAHGSGGRSCSRLLPGKTRAGVPVRERMGVRSGRLVRRGGSLVFTGDCQHGSGGRQAGGGILMV